MKKYENYDYLFHIAECIDTIKDIYEEDYEEREVGKVCVCVVYVQSFWKSFYYKENKKAN